MRNITRDNKEVVLIKKYSNRRLYHSALKRYVTLQDISAIINEGNEIKVIDTQSKEDITKQILIQVILENEKNKKDILPVQFLHKLIRYGNQLSKEYLDRSFVMMMQPYLENDQAYDPDNTVNISDYRETGSTKTQSVKRNNDIKYIKQRMEELEEKIRELSQ